MDAAVTSDRGKDTGTAKAAARKAAFARRKAVFGAPDHMARVTRANTHLCGVLGAYGGVVLAGYMPMRTEIDPLPAMQAHGGPVCVPVIEATAMPLRFALCHAGAALHEGAFGALVPVHLEYIVPQVLIVPLLSFDARGYRLGYGGGFYDRTLEALRRAGPVTAIGFAFAAQQVDSLPLEATDQPLDMIVTEEGVIRPR